MKLNTFASIIGTCSAGLCNILAQHYKHIPQNRDVYIWENFGFLLAYFHLIGFISSAELQSTIVEVSSSYPPNTCEKQSANAMLSSAEFYSKCFYDMLTVKTWTLPDRIVYNITHPMTWDDFSKQIPYEELNFLRVIDIWTSICGFVADYVKPHVESIR